LRDTDEYAGGGAAAVLFKVELAASRRLCWACRPRLWLEAVPESGLGD